MKEGWSIRLKKLENLKKWKSKNYPLTKNLIFFFFLKKSLEEYLWQKGGEVIRIAALEISFFEIFINSQFIKILEILNKN